MELHVGKYTGAEPLRVCIQVHIYRKHISNKLQTYCDSRFFGWLVIEVEYLYSAYSKV